MRLNPTPLITRDQIAARVADLGAELVAGLDALPLTVLVVLKGGMLFAADLVRHLPATTAVEYIHPRSYQGTESTGRVEIHAVSPGTVAGHHVIVVEDIVDTGRGYAEVLRWLAAQRPARITTCALLDKPARRVVPIVVDHIGFAIDDHFVVGYGLDLNEHYRGLGEIHLVESC